MVGFVVVDDIRAVLILFVGRVGQGDGFDHLCVELIGVAVRVGAAVDDKAARPIILDLDELRFDIDIRARVVGEHKIVTVVGDGRILALIHIAGRDGMRRALIDRQARVDHRVIQRGGHLADAAADAHHVVAVSDFQRGLIAVGLRALERDLVEGDGFSRADGQVVEALRADADVFRSAFHIIAGLADGGFKAAELHDLRFQLGARDRRFHRNRGQIDHAAFQRIDHRADPLVQPGDIQRLTGLVIRIGERRPLRLVVHTRGADGGTIHLGLDLGENLVDLAHVVGQRGVTRGGFFFKRFDLFIARGR